MDKKCETCGCFSMEKKKEGMGRCRARLHPKADGSERGIFLAVHKDECCDKDYIVISSPIEDLSSSTSRSRN